MFGLDYEETFSHVVRFESVRFLLAIGALHQLQLHQMDVSTAFLHGELMDEVYMRQPEGFIKPEKEHLVCHLKRSIYGLKQSPRCWNHTLDNRLKEMGFKQAPCDHCLYIHSDSEGEIFFVGVYVDDIILGGRSIDKMNAMKKELNEKLKMKDLCRATSTFFGSKNNPRSVNWSNLDWPTIIHQKDPSKVWDA